MCVVADKICADFERKLSCKVLIQAELSQVLVANARKVASSLMKSEAGKRILESSRGSKLPEVAIALSF